MKATPCQAMSNAVPWSTDVRMIGRPSVTLTPESKASSFIGPWPWSWYMHTIASYRRRCTAWKNTVSAGCGPLASMPSLDRRGDRRGDLLDVLRAEQAVLAGVRVESAHGDARPGEEAAQRRVGQLDHVEHARGRDPLDRLAQRAVRADVGDGDRSATVERGGEHHRHLACTAALGDQLGVADEAGIGQLRGLLVHRHRHHAGDTPGEGVVGGAQDVVARRRARRARRAGPAGDRRR